MANRGMSAAMQTGIAESNLRMFHLVEFHFSTIDYLTDWYIDLLWNSNTYLSSGNLINFENITESINPTVAKLKATYSGVNQENIAIALTENYTDKQVLIYRGLLDSNHAIIVDPILIYDGRIDYYELMENPGENGTSLLNWYISSHWADFEKVSGRRNNNTDQQNLFTGDLGFEFTSEIVKDLQWGKP